MKTFDTFVIGAGPAGMMAAIEASKKGTVCIADTNPAPGKKLLLTGGGRCNITTNQSVKDFLLGIPHHSAFLYSSLHQFSPLDTFRFFQSRNVKLKIEKNNAVFPVTDKSETIRFCLEEELKKKHILFRQATVQDVQKVDETFTITAQEGSFTTTWKSRFVILATGGKSYAHTGSTGFGYTLAQRLGHTIVPTEPGLVQLVVDSNPWKDCQGISLSNIGLRWKEGKKYLQGDFLFTEKGFSGPVVFDMSLDFFTERILCIDFLPHCSNEEWAQKVQEWRTIHSKMQMNTWLQQWFPKKLVSVLLKQIGFSDTITGAEFSKKEEARLWAYLRGGNENIVRKSSIEKAMVTLGGVHLKEIHPGSLGSKIQPGLFFAGEILDIAGKTGGYNLQIALSTGYVAGQLNSTSKRGEK